MDEGRVYMNVADLFAMYCSIKRCLIEHGSPRCVVTSSNGKFMTDERSMPAKYSFSLRRDAILGCDITKTVDRLYFCRPVLTASGKERNKVPPVEWTQVSLAKLSLKTPEEIVSAHIVKQSSGYGRICTAKYFWFMPKALEIQSSAQLRSSALTSPLSNKGWDIALGINWEGIKWGTYHMKIDLRNVTKSIIPCGSEGPEATSQSSMRQTQTVSELTHVVDAISCTYLGWARCCCWLTSRRKTARAICKKCFSPNVSFHSTVNCQRPLLSK